MRKMLWLIARIDFANLIERSMVRAFSWVAASAIARTVGIPVVIGGLLLVFLVSRFNKRKSKV